MTFDASDGVAQRSTQSSGLSLRETKDNKVSSTWRWDVNPDPSIPLLANTVPDTKKGILSVLAQRNTCEFSVNHPEFLHFTREIVAVLSKRKSDGMTQRGLLEKVLRRALFPHRIKLT